MSTPKNLSHLLPLLDAPDEQFDALWASMVAENPDLQTPGTLEMPVNGFRSMLKLSFLAGRFATAEQITSQE
jgi:hypothetical protein